MLLRLLTCRTPERPPKQRAAPNNDNVSSTDILPQRHHLLAAVMSVASLLWLLTQAGMPCPGGRMQWTPATGGAVGAGPKGTDSRHLHSPTLILQQSSVFTGAHLLLVVVVLQQLPASFTLGEAVLVAQAAACLVCMAAHTCASSTAAVVQLLWQHLLLAQSSPAAFSSSTSSSTPITSAVFVVLLCSLLLAATCAITLLATLLHLRGVERRPWEARCHCVLWACGWAGLGGCTTLMGSMAVWTLSWLLQSAARQQLLHYWLALLATALPLMLLLLRGGRVPLIVVRKGYHLLAVALFAPAAVRDPGMLAISLAAAFALLVALEAIRATRLGPLGEAVHAFMEGFTDSRDTGPLYLTHFTLLLGMALPVWLAVGIWDAPASPAPESRWLPWVGVSSTPAPLSPSSPSSPPSVLLLALSGVMTLGLGDTAASAVGHLLGRSLMFRGSKKTWEGTAAGFVATMAGWLLLCAAGCLQLPLERFLMLAGCTLAASLLEAATSQLDNLFVPLYYASAILAVMPRLPAALQPS